MDVGHGEIIDDKWIPQGVSTGIEDFNGHVLETSNKVKLNGCKSRYAIVGLSMKGNPVIYFGTANGSVMWSLDKHIVSRHKITFVE